MSKTIILIVSIFFIVSCNNNETDTTFQPVEIIPTLIGKGSLSGNEGISQSNLVIQNQTDWQNLMNQMDSNGNFTDTFSETDIDFENFMIIAIFDQVHGNDGWTIDIINITENENNIVITIDNLETGGLGGVITQPFHIVKISISNKPIVFE